MFNLLYIPLILINIFIFKYDSYEIYFNMNSNLITNTIYKISNYWSMIENNIFFLIIVIIVYTYCRNKKKLKKYIYNFLYLFFFFFILSFSITITSSNFYFNNTLFNPLLTHFLVFIHPPLILIITMLTRIEIEKKNIYIFYFYTATVLLGSFWATSVFGWGGWWSWDPIENISLAMWLLLFIYIHKVEKINTIAITLFIILDFFFFFFFKFNSFQSVHIFKILYISMQPFFISIYILILFITIYYISINKIKTIPNRNIQMIHIIVNALVITAYIICINININIKIELLYYIILVLVLIVCYIFTTILNIKYQTTLPIIVIINNIISIQYIIYFVLYYIYTLKKKNKLYTIHLICCYIIYLLLNINSEIYEITFNLIHSYTQHKYQMIISTIDININYIEFNFNTIQNIKYNINTYYNIYNIFEKIEYTIYNLIIESTYINIKNNIIQLYKIKYIILLLITNVILICARMDSNH